MKLLGICVLAFTVSASAQQQAENIIPLTQKQIDALADAQRKLNSALAVYNREMKNFDATQKAVLDQINLPRNTDEFQKKCGCTYEYAIIGGKYVLVQKDYNYVWRSR